MEFMATYIEDLLGPQSDFIRTDEVSLKEARVMATDLLSEVMSFRRTPNNHVPCEKSCLRCLNPHLSAVIAAIRGNRPIQFVLPAFPGKSPNSAKVLGPLPDMAEQLSLQFLDDLCKRIQKTYKPGANVILCSDGRVFSDAVGIREEDVSAYQEEISSMIKRLSLTSISTFNLDDVYPGLGFVEMRRDLMRKYGKSVDELKSVVRQAAKENSTQEEQDAHRLYCGITRFLFEDAMTPGQTKTRSAIQKDCRLRAYEVIQRSNAWSELVANHFSNAVRLSIHPQVCGSKKLGIRLVDADSWMTPWHGVAVEVEGRFQLIKRSQAEELGAKLIYREGLPSHFKLSSIQEVNVV